MPDQPASNRLRIGRYDEPNRIYLLTSNTLDRIPVFSDFKLGRLVVQQFQIAQHQGLVTSLAWVVMPDHFHWLIELRRSTLSTVMQRTKTRSARAVNAAQQQDSQLWQKGYHDRAIRYEHEIPSIARYIVANPLRAGLVKRLADYPHWDAIWL